MALELEFGMMLCSMLGDIGEEMALHFSSAKMFLRILLCALEFSLRKTRFQNSFKQN